ncbi:MAG: hypothetical protein GYB51_05890 [Rhodobacteraceae bacterium]|nr:hypothetical protein [Paracoccaceae bacterium]
MTSAEAVSPEPPRGLRSGPARWSDLTAALRWQMSGGDGGTLDARLVAGPRGPLADGPAPYIGSRAGTCRLNGKLLMLSADHATPFLAGSMISTPDGRRRVESLRPGDMVSTLDNGAQRVLWTGRRRVAGDGRLAPIEIRPGVLGNLLPVRVAASQQLVLKDPAIAMLFGGDEAVVAARHLLDGTRVRRAPQRLVEHVLLVTEGYQVLDQGDFGLECAEPPILAEAEEAVLGDVGLCVRRPLVQARLRQARGHRPGLTGYEGRLLGAMIAAGAAVSPPRPDRVPETASEPATTR